MMGHAKAVHNAFDIQLAFSRNKDHSKTSFCRTHSKAQRRRGQPGVFSPPGGFSEARGGQLAPSHTSTPHTDSYMLEFMFPLVKLDENSQKYTWQLYILFNY
ncbi:hypothetical protein GOODEAATRI_020778 [Goodea atripinnis]|uniref:Uncharacterized protein n=1 Tax=Goodea atripinnis TaxID=208336 RepID=A0ABV0PQB7_9TELE